MTAASVAYKFSHNRPHSMLSSQPLLRLSPLVPVCTPRMASRSFICPSLFLPTGRNPFAFPLVPSAEDLSYRDRISPSNFPLVRAESQSNNHLRALHSYLTRRGSRSYTPPCRRYPPATPFSSSPNMPADGNAVR